VNGVYSHVPFEAEQSDFDQLESPISFNDVTEPSLIIDLKSELI
jgi:hypothetical protein